MPGGQQLSRKQEKAIAALLSEPSIQRAAEAAKVSERTLKYWLKQPEFAREYRIARQQLVEHAVTVLQRVTSLAVVTLHRNMSCGKPATEVLAASKILEHAVGGLEVFDLAQRVAELEQAIQTQGAGYDSQNTFANGQTNNGPYSR
jgi:hypothetical protein